MSSNEDLEKPFSELCTISENENKFQGIIEWHITESEIKQYLQKYEKGNSVNSNSFSISSTSFYFSIQPHWETALDESYPPKDLSRYSEAVDVCIVFHKKLPEYAWVKGEIYFSNINGPKTFSIRAKEFDKSIKIQELCCNSDLFNCLSSTKGAILHCSIKINMKEVKCAFDKEKVTYTEISNYTSSKDTIQYDAFSDVSIYINDHVFKTNKVLLAQIPYFQELFDTNKSEECFELSNIEENVFNHILIFLHSGDIPRLNFKLACKLYIVASDLKILALKCLCSSYLGANLTENNVTIILKFSHEYQDTALKKECFKFIKNSDVEVLTTKSIIL